MFGLSRCSWFAPPTPAYVICVCSCMAATTEYPPLPVQIPSFISIAFVLEVPEEALTCSLRGAARIRTLPLAGVPPNLLGLADGHALVPLPFFRQCKQPPPGEASECAPVCTPSLECAAVPCQRSAVPIICSIVCPRLPARCISATLLRGCCVSEGSCEEFQALSAPQKRWDITSWARDLGVWSIQ